MRVREISSRTPTKCSYPVSDCQVNIKIVLFSPRLLFSQVLLHCSTTTGAVAASREISISVTAMIIYLLS